MAVGQGLQPLPAASTDDFVQANKRFFPQEITVGHHQLRHLISCPSPHRIYLVNRSEVICIDTLTRRKKHIADLPFDARCTATGYGWFCAGGEDRGYFAAIRIPDGTSSSPTPLLDRSPYSSTILDSFDRPFPPRIRIERLGSDIVNSISLHRLPSITEGEPDDIVALLTNNDRTVRMYSLTRDKELNVEEFAFEMNHATISPDGRILMIVGDKEFAYFFRRIEDRKLPENTPQWERLRVMRLFKPAQKPRDSITKADASAYFATAWSPSGHLCAAGSEDGYIMLFDTRSLLNSDCSDQDCVISVVASSRAGTPQGAVRTMCFSPEPLDLLIWVEQHARVCVSDVRQSLGIRQVIEIDPDAGTTKNTPLQTVSNVTSDPGLEEFDDDLDFIRRHQQALGLRSSSDNEDPSDALLSRVLEQEPEHRSGLTTLLSRLRESRSRDHRQGNTDGLDPREREVLEILNTTSQDRATVEQLIRRSGSSVPRSFDYSSGSTRMSALTNPHNQSDRPLEDHEVERFLQLVRTYGRDHPNSIAAIRREPRRQHSVIVSSTTRDHPSTSSRLTDDPDRESLLQSTLRHLRAPPTAPSSTREEIEAEAERLRERTIEAGRRFERLRVMADADPRYRELNTELERNLERARDRERDRRARERQWAREVEQLAAADSVLGRRSGLLGVRAPARLSGLSEDGFALSSVRLRQHWGIGTAGCCVDDGGRIIYIGTDDGIFELCLNEDSRKCWPSIEMR